MHLGKFSTQTEAKIAIDEHHSKNDEAEPGVVNVKAAKVSGGKKEMKNIQDSSSVSKGMNQIGFNRDDGDGDDGDSVYKQKEGESECDTGFEEDEHDLGDSSDDEVRLPLSDQKNKERARRRRSPRKPKKSSACKGMDNDDDDDVDGHNSDTVDSSDDEIYTFRKKSRQRGMMQIKAKTRAKAVKEKVPKESKRGRQQEDKSQSKSRSQRDAAKQDARNKDMDMAAVSVEKAVSIAYRDGAQVKDTEFSMHDWSMAVIKDKERFQGMFQSLKRNRMKRKVN